MYIIQIVIAFIQNLFLKFSDKQDRDLSHENWWNEGDKYPEKKQLADEMHPPSPEQEVSDTSMIQFHSPVQDDQPFVTSPYGNRVLYKGAPVSFHSGTDFRAPQNSPAFAVEDCVVIEVVVVGKQRNRFARKPDGTPFVKYSAAEAPTPRIVVKGLHTGNVYKHKHCQKDAGVRVGDTIPCGGRLGHYGDYGYSLGSHCHFQVYVWDGDKHIRTNPRLWLKKRAGIISVGRTRSVSVKEFDALYVGK